MQKGDMNDPAEFEKAVKFFEKSGGVIDEDRIDPELEKSINGNRLNEIEYSQLEINQKILYNLEGIKRGIMFFVWLTVISIGIGVVLAIIARS